MLSVVDLKDINYIIGQMNPEKKTSIRT